jgi:RNA polymerase sigma-70 factor (ECF subfamily)
VAFEDELGDDLVVPDDARARERAVAALTSVAASQRAALVLCYVDGFTVGESAALLGKSVDAVESLLARGRQSFKRAFEQEIA